MMLDGMATQVGVHLQLHHAGLSGEELEQNSDQVMKLWTSSSPPSLHVRVTRGSCDRVASWPPRFMIPS